MKRITLLMALVVCSFGFAQQSQLQTGPEGIQNRTTSAQTTSADRSAVEMFLGDDGQMHAHNPNGAIAANRSVLPTTLSTLYAGGNGGDNGGAVYFNLTVGPQDIDVTSVDMNTDEAGAFTVDMYAFVGTYVGNQGDPTPWGAPVATGSGTAAGVGLPSTATFGSAVTLLANTTYAVALVFDATHGHTYTNGDGTNQQYSNADLTLDLGSGSNVPFTGPTFDPRVWNGGITYDISGGGGGGCPIVSDCNLMDSTPDDALGVDIWDRPFAGGTCCSGLGPVSYDVYGPFTVDTSGPYDILSVQTGGWDGYLFVYENCFDPLDQLNGFVAGDDDGAGGIGTSDIIAAPLVTGTEYYVVTTGFAAGDFGDFVNTINGPGTVTCGGGGGGSNEWTVLVEDLSGNFGDEVTWELRDNTAAVILSGGPYAPNYSDLQMVTTSNEPLEFFISAVGAFNDNTPNYTVSCGGNVIVSGSLSGGDTATESGLVCAPVGPMCNINYANVIAGVNGSPSQIFPDFGDAQGISADDFIIPLLPTQAAAICDISVNGVFSAGGFAADPNSEIILNLYTDAAGTPDNLIFSETFDAVTADPGNTGSFTLTPTGTINLVGGTTYYASVVVRMEFGLAGQWFWLSATDGNDGEMQWEDTDDLFGTGCTTWMPGSACGINGGDPDLLMNINFMQVPSFDECAGAIALVCDDVVTGDTTLNTDTGGFNAAPDAWYSYTGTGAEEFITVSLCDGGTTYDSRLTLYDACGVPELLTNDDFCGLQSQLSFLSDGTTTYYIAVEGFNAAAAGPYSLEITCNPVAANDECANAQEVNCGDVVAGSTNFATIDTAALDCGVGITAPGVWYTFTDSTGLLTNYSVDTCDGGTTYDSKITVYVGDDCGTLTCIGDNDDDCGLQSTVAWQSADVATYYVLVHGFGGATGDFSLSINCDGVPPPNDMIANSIDVDEIGFPYTDPNVAMPFATTEAGTPVDCDNAGAKGVWYNFVPAGNGNATATIVSPAGPSSVTFYTAPNESAVETDLVHIDYFLNQCVDGTEATILTAAGQAYYVYVYNHGGPTDIVIDGESLGTVDNTIEGFGFYPNPAKDMLTLNAADTIESVEIYNIVGQQVLKQAIDATTTELNISDLSTGTYIMKVLVNGQSGVYKVIKE